MLAGREIKAGALGIPGVLHDDLAVDLLGQFSRLLGLTDRNVAGGGAAQGDDGGPRPEDLDDRLLKLRHSPASLVVLGVQADRLLHFGQGLLVNLPVGLAHGGDTLLQHLNCSLDLLHPMHLTSSSIVGYFPHTCGGGSTHGGRTSGREIPLYSAVLMYIELSERTFVPFFFNKTSCVIASY